jgi:hypothetical protein
MAWVQRVSRLSLGFFLFVYSFWSDTRLALGGLSFLPESQWRGSPPYWYPQPPATYYRITAGGLILLVFLGIILICLIAATVYLLIIYKKRMNDLEDHYSRFDESLKDLYRKQKEDLDTVLQHVYELRKRTEAREPASRPLEKDTYVGKRDLPGTEGQL